MLESFLVFTQSVSVAAAEARFFFLRADVACRAESCALHLRLFMCHVSAAVLMEEQVERAWSALLPDPVALPWESFPDRTFLSFPLRLDLSRPTAVPMARVAAEPPAKKARPGTFSSKGSVALRVSAKPWHEDDRRAAALYQIQAIVEAWPEAFGLAKLCRQASGLDFEELTFSLQAAVMHKATSTVVRRLSSLSHYVKWAAEARVAPFPVTEKVAWAYLLHLQRNEAAWSKPSGFRQAVNWCRGVLDLLVEDDYLSSPRVVGLCKGMESKAPPPKRAPALTFEEVLFLETVAAAGENVQDVVVAGAVLFMLFACARASDAARAVSLWVDFSDVDGATVWIDSEVKKSKTAIGSRARLLLPLLAPCVVFRLDWAKTWLDAREHLGLAIEGAIDEGSLIPLFNEAGDWSGRPMSPQHLTAWLRDTLSPSFPDAQRLSSHSLKATGLTWAASAGVPLDTRRLLAHHVHDSARSTETYSRDVLTPAARMLEEVLLAIKDGAFCPDQPRGKQFKEKSRTLQLTTEVPEVDPAVYKSCRPRDPDWPRADASDVPHAAEEHLSDTEDSASERLSDEDIPPDPPLPATRERRPAIALLPRWCVSYMHVVSGCLHVASGDDKLLCGRKLSDRYFKTDVVELDMGRPHCKQCWSHTSLDE